MVGKYVVASEVYGEYVDYAKAQKVKGLVALSWEAWLSFALTQGHFDGLKYCD